MTDSDPASEKTSKVSRRGVIKWAGALAAVGVVGVGLGFGGDLLIRPNTNKTTTAAGTTVTASGTTQTTTVTGSGSTTTLTVPPPTLSYIPPLSSSVQSTVNGIFDSLASNHTGETVTYSGCGALGCMTHCFIKVLTKNGVITSIVPEDTINTGIAREDQLGLDVVKTGMIQFRGCPLGYGWKQMVYDPNRLLYPMKQVGTKGAGSMFTRITWTEALDTIAAQFSNCNTKYGPYSIVSSHSGTNNGNTLLSALGYGVTTWGAYSSSGFDIAEPLIEGGTESSGGAASSIADMFNSKLVILLGRLPTTVDGQGGGFGYACILAKEAGVKFISVDCRYTVDAQALNAQWIPIRQGTDMALLLAIADVMFKQNLVNQAFVTQYVEPNGFATWKNYVTGVSDGVEKSPQWAASITGVPAATITALAQLYASSNPSKLLLGWEMTRPSNVNIARAGVLLQAMAGYTLTPGGGGPLESGYTKNSWSTISYPTVNIKGTISGSKWPAVAFNTIRWHKAINLQPQLQSGQITLAQFNAQIDALASAPAVNPKFLFWNSSPDAAIGVFGANERVAALKQTFAYLFVWKSPNTHAARYFDIILPSTEIYMEEPGDGTNGINRFLSNGSSTYNNAFIYAAPAIIPLGEARPQTWMYTMIAKRFGVDKQTDPVVSALFTQDQWDPVAWNNAMETVHQTAYNTWAASVAIAPLNPPSWADFKKNPIFRVPAITVGPYAAWINASPPQNPWSGTTSGKIEPSSSFLTSTKAQTTNVPGGSAGQVIGYVGSGGTAIPTWVDQLAYTFVDSRASTYPLCLITPQSYYRHHSCGFLNPYLNGDCYQHRLWMSVPDATARGITDGAQVHIFSDGGEEIVPAYVTSRMTPGTVALYHGGYYTPSNEKTALMPDGIDMVGDPNFLMTDIMPDKTISDPCIGSGPVQVELYQPPNGAGVVTTTTSK